jgi:hypothetical protein
MKKVVLRQVVVARLLEHQASGRMYQESVDWIVPLSIGVNIEIIV